LRTIIYLSSLLLSKSRCAQRTAYPAGKGKAAILFSIHANSRRRVVAKLDFYAGELFPRNLWQRACADPPDSKSIPKEFVRGTAGCWCPEMTNS